MEIAIGAAQWVVGRALGPVSDGLLESWAASSKLGPRIRELKMELLYAQAMLDSARAGADGIRGPALAQLLLELRQLAYSADDVLDELEYFRIQDELEGTYETTDPQERGLVHGLILNARHTARDVASKFKLSSCSCHADNHGDHYADGGCMAKIIPASSCSAARAVGKRLHCYSPQYVHGAMHAPKLKFDRVEMSKRMEDIVEQLKPVCAKVSTILQLELLGSDRTTPQITTSDRPKTTPQIIEPKLYGRKNQRKDILNDITGKYSANDLTVLSFVGPGGIGKTTFIQHIYQELKSYFDVLVWVSVSQDFNVNRLAQEIVKQISKSNDEKENSSDEERIEKRLQSKQFLLVLDDIWIYQEDEWKRLLVPFTNSGTKGNIIIVTTRIPMVAQMVATKNCSTKLERLEDEDCMDFFKACVFGDEQLWKDHADLHVIGRKIVERLKGNPLAVKTVGRLLRNQLSKEYWTRVLESREWELMTSQDDIMPVLKLSYNYLPFHLKQCFSYCGLFPEDYKFTKKELTHLWIGLGLLCNSDRDKRTEDMGQSYMHELVDNGFFDRVENENGCPYFIIHDLLHELAINVSLDECLSINSSNLWSIQVPTSVRHLSVTVDDTDVNDRMTFEKFKRGLTTLDKKLKGENLRTLMLFGEYHGSFAKTLGNLFREAKTLRVIFLSGASYSVEDLLHKFSKLVHLRYLRIKDSQHTGASLPNSISRLYNLIVLDVKQCNDHFAFLRDMSKLVKIRHCLVKDDSLHSDISEVGKLKFLQELRRFEVKKEINGFELKQLGQLQQLHGSLSIYNLEKVETIKEAEEAKLADMNHLNGLTLAWDINQSNKDLKQEECIEGLKTHSNVRELCIEGHGGDTRPTWLSVDFIENLESLHLKSVAWNMLPVVGKLCMVNEHGGECMSYDAGQGFQNLKSLELVDIPRLKKWCADGNGDLLSHLEELIITSCSELMELPFAYTTCSQPKQEEKNMTYFPRLKTLKISECPKLLSLPLIPWTRQPCSIVINKVGSAFEQLSYQIVRETKARLEIKRTYTMDVAFWNVLAFDNLAELEELKIHGCPPLPLDHLRMLASLKTLEISNSANVLCKFEGESSVQQELLESLKITNCGASGKELTRLLTHFPNLSTLLIEGCERIAGLGVVEQQMAAIEEAPVVGEELLLLPPLRILQISDCSNLTLSNSWSSSNFPFPRSLQILRLKRVSGDLRGDLAPLTNLKTLVIQECGDLRGECFWPLLTQGHLTTLSLSKSPKFLSGYEPSRHYHSPGLRNLWTDDITGALAAPLCHLLSSSLTDCALMFNDEVEVFTKHQEQALENLTSLEELRIVVCPKLRFLPAGLSRLPNLKRLAIAYCPSIRVLPNDILPSSLQDLEIQHCPAIRSLPKDGLPTSLRKLDVSDRNNEELRRQCRKLTGTIPIIRA